MRLRDFQREVHELAVSKGWYPTPIAGDPNAILARLALIHSEVSEAVECVRDGKIAMTIEPDRFGQDKPEGLVVELGDVVIRTLDLCEALGLDLEEAIERKHEMNKTRKHRHGGRLA